MEEPTPISDHTEQNIRDSHAEYVRKLAGTLFDCTEPLHELGENSRQILADAAILREMVKPQKKKKALRSAGKLVREQFPEGLSSNQQDVLTAVIVFSQGNFKQKNLTSMGLDPVQEREALTLISLLRIASGLNETRSQSTAIQQTEVSKEMIWIVVDGPEASVDATAGQYNAALWEKVGYPEIKILESSEAQKEILPYPEPVEVSGVVAEDSMADAGLKVFRFHFANMLAYEPGTRSGENMEDLHKMRVATRRMRAAFIVFEDAFQIKYVRPYLKGLRMTGRMLGRVRDWDVLIDNASRYAENLPEEQKSDMVPLMDAWTAAREHNRDRLCSFLDSEEYTEFRRTFNLFLHNPGPGVLPVPDNLPIPSRVKELAPVLIYERLAEVRAFEPLLVDASIETLHALRIEIKRLRYTVEFFQDILGPDVGSIIDQMKSMQDHLGELNDDQIAAQRIAQFLEDWDIDQEQLPISERRNPETIVSYMAYNHSELHRLTATFKDVWAAFNQEEFRRQLALAISVL